MQKQMKIMLICMAILFGSLFLYKFMINYLMNRAMANQSHATVVSAMTVDYSNWQKRLSASGSLRAIHGVNVTTQLAGMVQKIYLKPGVFVNENDLLVQLNADDDIALLEARKASAELK